MMGKTLVSNVAFGATPEIHLSNIKQNINQPNLQTKKTLAQPPVADTLVKTQPVITETKNNIGAVKVVGIALAAGAGVMLLVGRINHSKLDEVFTNIFKSVKDLRATTTQMTDSFKGVMSETTSLRETAIKELANAKTQAGEIVEKAKAEAGDIVKNAQGFMRHAQEMAQNMDNIVAAKDAEINSLKQMAIALKGQVDSLTKELSESQNHLKNEIIGKNKLISKLSLKIKELLSKDNISKEVATELKKLLIS